MPELSLRFAIATDDGKSSDVWKCWTNVGAGRRDVYLTSRPLGHALKLSLHEGGQWHVGFASHKKDELFEPGQAPKSRFLGKWDRPHSLVSPLVLAARLYVPWFSPSAQEREAPRDTVWIPSAPRDHSVEVTVFLLTSEVEPDGWPGRDSLGTQLVGQLPLEGGGRVCIVYRDTTTWPTLPTAQPNLRPFAGNSQADLLNANRMVAWNEESDGSIVFIEVPITVSAQSAG